MVGAAFNSARPCTRMAAEATDPAQDGSLSRQAAAYRKLAMNGPNGRGFHPQPDKPAPKA